jgi:hypothetical protein
VLCNSWYCSVLVTCQCGVCRLVRKLLEVETMHQRLLRSAIESRQLHSAHLHLVSQRSTSTDIAQATDDTMDFNSKAPCGLTSVEHWVV